MAEVMHTIADAAPLLGMKRQTAYRAVWSGLIAVVDARRPGAKKPSWRIPQSVIDAFAATAKPAGDGLRKN